MTKDDTLDDWELNTITIIKYIFSILSNIYYIMIFIVYIKQGCALSIKKALILLMTLTLFTTNTLYLFVFYGLVKERTLDKNRVAPKYCIIVTAVKSTLLLINNYHLSFIFLYTYMGLYHSEFLFRNKKKFCFIYLGLTWAIGIGLFISLCFDESMIVTNTGDCSPSNILFTFLSLFFSLTSVLILIFSLMKIYLNLRRSEEPDDDETKAYKKKLFILGVIILLELFLSFILYPLYFYFPTNSALISVRISMQIGVSFVFVMFYSYDEDFGITMKETFLCKKNNILLTKDTIYDVLSPNSML